MREDRPEVSRGRFREWHRKQGALPAVSLTKLFSVEDRHRGKGKGGRWRRREFLGENSQHIRLEFPLRLENSLNVSPFSLRAKPQSDAWPRHQPL